MVAGRVAEHGRTLDELLPTPQAAHRFTDGMPSTRVAIAMKIHYFKNAAKNWSAVDRDAPRRAAEQKTPSRRLQENCVFGGLWGA